MPVNTLVDAPLSLNVSCQEARAVIERRANQRPFRRLESLKRALPTRVQAHLARCRAKDDCFTFAALMIEARQLASVRPI